ncbi:MAG TPA: hypothetical protein VGL99_23240 [Chloroflexota bacterium]
MRSVLTSLCTIALLLVVPSAASAQVAVESVTFMRDDGAGAPGEVVSAFRPTDHTLYVQTTVDQVLVNPKGHVFWTAVETSAGDNIAIADADLSGVLANTFTAHLSLPRDFPTGRYRVDFTLDDQLLQSAEFFVVE